MLTLRARYSVRTADGAEQEIVELIENIGPRAITRLVIEARRREVETKIGVPASTSSWSFVWGRGDEERTA